MITNSYFTFFFNVYMSKCRQFEGLSTGIFRWTRPDHTIKLYSSTGRGTSYSNNKKIKIKYLSIQLLIRGTCRGATELWNKHREFPYLTSLFF